MSTEGLLFVRVSTETQPECTDTRGKRFCFPPFFLVFPLSPTLSFLLTVLFFSVSLTQE